MPIILKNNQCYQIIIWVSELVLLQADNFFTDSVPKGKDANCNDLIHVNVLSRDVNISRLKGQYVQVQNCEECTNPPFFVYQHQCYEFNGIYLQWFENVKRYEVQKISTFIDSYELSFLPLALYIYLIMELIILVSEKRWNCFISIASWLQKVMPASVLKFERWSDWYYENLCWPYHCL